MRVIFWKKKNCFLGNCFFWQLNYQVCFQDNGWCLRLFKCLFFRCLTNMEGATSVPATWGLCWGAWARIWRRKIVSRRIVSRRRIVSMCRVFSSDVTLFIVEYNSWIDVLMNKFPHATNVVIISKCNIWKLLYKKPIEFNHLGVALCVPFFAMKMMFDSFLANCLSIIIILVMRSMQIIGRFNDRHFYVGCLWCILWKWFQNIYLESEYSSYNNTHWITFSAKKDLMWPLKFKLSLV